MGESGFTSHMKGKKHKECAPSSSLLDFHFQKSSDPVPTATRKGTSHTLDKMLINSSVLQAEVRLALKIVMSRYSEISCNYVTELFKIMFPDSDIAKSFTCAKTKCSCMIVYGLAPYFQSCRLDDLMDSAYHVISFDECFTSVLHFGQMDFAIRFWSSSKKLVENLYLTSEFLQGAKAEQLVEKYNASSMLDQSKLVQISSDGPNVNLKFLQIIKDFQEELDHLPLIDIGTCGLCTVHGSFKTGLVASRWQIEKILKCMWYFLKSSPARREVYETITQTKTYPLPYCQTRWCKNEPVAERAAEIWPVYCKFIQHLASLPKSKQPQNKSFDGLLLPVSDPLICAKFKFVESILWKLNTFLRGFQTDKPMVSFLFSTLEDLLRWLMKKFILRETLEKADSVKKLFPQSVKCVKIPKKGLWLCFRIFHCISLKNHHSISTIVWYAQCFDPVYMESN